MAAVKNGVPEEPQGIWGASAEIAVLQPLMPEVDGATLLYNTNLKVPIYTEVNVNPKAVEHSTEWPKILAGDPVLIPEDDGDGMKVMTIDEWTYNWKRNDDFPDCLACGSLRTREHHFIQTWCRSKKHWTSETLCLDCHCWSWRYYHDPGFMTSEDHEKFRFEKFDQTHAAKMAARRAIMPN